MTTTPKTSNEVLKASTVRVVLAKDGMTAMMALSKPQRGESEAGLDEVKAAIDAAGIVHGVSWEDVDKALGEREWDTPIRIAVGTRAQKGNDATFEYSFETERDQAPEEDEDGRIDYRSLNFIQNVEKDQELVRKTPPTDGIDGTSVRGTPVKAAAGRDLPFQSGKNTLVSEDGLTLLATACGSIVLTRNGISVNDVTSIQGDVDMSVGNIDCAGSVTVGGEIKAGFHVDVGGNLDVRGNVQDSFINCRGNILIKGGCFGKGEGKIQAQGDIVIKYAEGLVIEAGNNLTVGGELLNCQVTAGEKVDVCGKKGTIVGGKVCAGKEIRVSVAGSEAGTTTELYVAYDAETEKEYRETIVEIERVNADLQRVKKTLYGLYRLQGDGKLQDSQQGVLNKLEEFQAGVPDALKALEKNKAQIEERMREFEDAHIIIKDTLHAGVVAHFGPIYREFTDSQKRCKLTLEGNRIMVSEWKEDRDTKH